MGLSAGTRLGPYEILDPLGAGGMGEVYRARDTRLGRFVAVKILPDAVSQDPRRVSLFETEARALAALSHPNILGIHDFGQSEGRLYTVTELLQGEGLQDRMAGEPLPWRKSAQLAASIADGLSSAHSAGIVHRDLKPSNIFITSDGHVKILDFGLAKSSEAVSQDAVTQTSPSAGAIANDGEIVGTLSYMAPEQLRGLRLDGRADIFSLGCILFEMLSGKRPFTRATRVDTLSAILREEPQHLDVAASGIPRALAAIVFRCLEKRPEDRFDTAHDLAIALRTVYSDGQLAIPTMETIGRPLWRWIAASILFVAVLAGLGLLLRSARSFARSASGQRTWGPPHQITSASASDAEPALSPDGTLVAYSSNAGGSTAIWVVDVQGGEPMRLTDGTGEDRKPAWFPDGRSIAYASIRGGRASIWKIPRLGGSSSLLIEDADMPAISPDGRRIAFARSGPEGLLRIWTAQLDLPTNAVRITGNDGGLWDHTDPVWSPDGSKLCYSDFKNLWVVEIKNGKLRQLTAGDAWYADPAWSASGDFVYCSSYRGANNPMWAIWRIPLDREAQVRETTGSGPERHPAISHQNHVLVYSTASPDRDIVVIDRTRGTTSQMGSARTDDTPSMAPNGEAVVYSSDRLGKYDLWLQPLVAGRPSPQPARRLTDLDTDPATPTFSPDGEWVAYFRVVNNHRDIWMVPARGGVPVRVTNYPGQNVHPAFSPDGSQLAFISSRSGLEHVWIVPIHGASVAGEPFQLTDGPKFDMFPAFSTAGDRLTFVRDGEIWVTEPRRGASARQLTTGSEIHYAAWEPDGRSVLASGMWGTSILRIRRVHLDSGIAEPVSPDVALGSRDASGYFSLTHDGRYLAVEVVETKGNLWSIALPADRH